MGGLISIKGPKIKVDALPLYFVFNIFCLRYFFLLVSRVYISSKNGILHGIVDFTVCMQAYNSIIFTTDKGGRSYYRINFTTVLTLSLEHCPSKKRRNVYGLYD